MAYRDEVLADNPHAYYRLADLSGSAAVDEVGDYPDGEYQQNDGTITLNRAGAMIDGSGRSVLMDWSVTGTSPRVNVINSVGGSFGSSTATITVEFWTRQVDGEPRQRVNMINTGIGSSPGINVSCGVANETSTEGAITVILVLNSTRFARAWKLNTGIDDGQWHHVVAVFARTATFVRLYLDGVEIPTGSFDGYETDFDGADTLNDFNFGYFDLRGDGSANVSELAVYWYELGADRVAAHYAAAFTSLPRGSFEQFTELGTSGVSDAPLGPLLRGLRPDFVAFTELGLAGIVDAPLGDVNRFRREFQEFTDLGGCGAVGVPLGRIVRIWHTDLGPAGIVDAPLGSFGERTQPDASGMMINGGFINDSGIIGSRMIR